MPDVAIDRYSRLITFLQCSTNNKAQTAVSLLEQTLETYGVPSKFRTVKEGENTLIWRKMVQLKLKGVEAILQHLPYISSGLNAYVKVS